MSCMYIHSAYVCIYIVYIYAHIQMLICMLVSERFFRICASPPSPARRSWKQLKEISERKEKGATRSSNTISTSVLVEPMTYFLNLFS